MRTETLTRIVLKIAMALVLTGILWPADWCLAAQKSASLPAHYPKEFTFVGCIQRITSNEAVISDSLHKFALGVSFHTPKTESATRAWFRPGSMVGVIINSRHEIESLWYLESGSNLD